MKLTPIVVCLCLGWSDLQQVAAADNWVQTEARAGSFPLVQGERAADIVFAAEDFKVVSIAANDFAGDMERVTGRKPVVRTNATGIKSPVVLIGTLGKSRLIDELVRAGKLDATSLRGQWESFLITAVANPLPGVSQGLVIVGSDRRGTAYGVYEMSQAIGISPWHWWADVAPERKPALFVASGTRRFGPPSVKYRGIFINDEDWGLQPWATKTFEPDVGDIGPKTYAKVFELMLRLKANTLWPAMHACTKPFNHYPQNKLVADDYAIVMGSSHAEPMLRNNVGEWTGKAEEFNYAVNRDGVLKYWEQRVSENGKFENIYTLGMRGVHDSAMQGPKTRPEQIKLLEQIFTDQRALLTNHVNPNVEQVPQMFCAYKEVLDLYRAGLKVPEDATIVWPDDNFGYIRNFANETERRRNGGFGIYYHISYLGRPLSYLWLCTTPPALIWEEMNKAYDHGADRIWIVNVGDLKPAEIGVEFFLQMAWDIKRWQRNNLPDFLREWAAREFGATNAGEIAAIMAQYYRLNSQRKPEHLQWWLPGQPPQPSPFADAEIDQRLAAFAELRTRVNRVMAGFRSEQRDGFFELVAYPVRGAALANERYFLGERAALAAAAGDEAKSRELAARAEAADARLKNETRVFNEVVAGGKWRGLLRLEPADKQWSSMRVASWELPRFSRAVNTNSPIAATDNFRSTNSPPPVPSGFVELHGVVSIEAEDFSGKTARGGGQWEIIPGLGRSADSVAIFPTTMPSVDSSKLSTDAPRLDYVVQFSFAGEFPVQLDLIPAHPIVAGGKIRVGIGIDDQPPMLVVMDDKDGGPDWAQGVLNGTRTMATKLTVTAPGAHTLHIYGVDAGVVLDKIVIDCGGLRESYLGPAETRMPVK